MYDDAPYDGHNVTGCSYLAHLLNGPCQGYVEALSDCRILMVPYGDGYEMYRMDSVGQWWHAPKAKEQA